MRTDDDYLKRVNRAIDHIVENLEHPLKLDDVARVAYFSPFHFHRVFKAMLGETLSQFVKRLRLEQAVKKMLHGKTKSLTEIALSCGFGSSSDFSRSFRQRYGVPPSAFDIETFRAQRRDEVKSTIPEEALHRLDGLPEGGKPDDFDLRLKELPARRVAYIRVLEPFRERVVVEAAERLLAWAEARGLADGQWLGYMWDDPEIVALKDCRYDVGLVVDDVKPEGEIGRFEFPPMLVAEVEIKGPIDAEMRVLDWLFRTWLPRSGYVPANLPGFEAWIGRPFAHGEEHFELHAQLPVERA